MLLERLPRVGPVTVQRLIATFGSAERAVTAPDAEFAAVAGSASARARRDPSIRDAVSRTLDECVSQGVDIVSLGSRAYPAALLHLADPPPTLYLRGPLSLPRGTGVAVVGSRRSTATGRKVAQELAAGLAREGIPVVSGIALGIDGAAHRGALAVAGPTVAVLGCGTDRPYPRAHARLFAEIAREGLLVSEFPPGTDPAPHHFPRRNRIIAALSRAVVVVEAGERSGALITVDHALDLGLDVFACPGREGDPVSEGCRRLIRDGARAVGSVAELLDQLGGDLRVATPADGAPGVRPAGVAGRVFEALDAAGVSADEVARRSGMGVGPTLAALSTLEAGGWVRRGPGMRFAVVRTSGSARA